MTREEHKAHHELLHRTLDELLADFLTHNPAALPSKTPILDLIKWSHQQTIDPTEAQS